MKIFRTHLTNEQDTEKLAEALAKFTVAGDRFYLNGTLGTGKTTFSRAFVHALGSKDAHVPSPTFTLVQTYDDARLPVAHVDCYRIENPDIELEALNLSPFFRDGVTLLEWADKVQTSLPPVAGTDALIAELDIPDALTINMSHGSDDSRDVEMFASGSWAFRLERIGTFGEKENKQEHRYSEHEYMSKNGLRGHVLTPLFQDCSLRSYSRFKTGEGSRVLMNAPPGLEDLATFVRHAKSLKMQGVNVPAIYEYNLEHGYAMLEDFGDTILHKALIRAPKDELLLSKAFEMLKAFQSTNLTDIPRYTEDTTFAEASRFTDWYLPYAKGHATPTGARREWRNLWFDLYPQIAAMPQVPVHWDFHVGNMMVLESGELGLIDFQDVKLGSCAFDLACLLEDRYPVSEHVKQTLIANLAEHHGVATDAFEAAYVLGALHRMFKVTGLLVRLKERDGKEDALARMGEVWQTIARLCEHPVAAPIKEYLNRVYPVYEEKYLKAQKAS